MAVLKIVLFGVLPVRIVILQQSAPAPGCRYSLGEKTSPELKHAAPSLAQPLRKKLVYYATVPIAIGIIDSHRFHSQIKI